MEDFGGIVFDAPTAAAAKQEYNLLKRGGHLVRVVACHVYQKSIYGTFDT
jgi:hypothetical protein